MNGRASLPEINRVRCFASVRGCYRERIALNRGVSTPFSLLGAIAPVSALLVSVAVLLAGNGLQITLIPVRANLENFIPLEIGLLGTAYFVGFTAGCVHGPILVRRAGHIRAFLAMTSLASAVPILHAMEVDPVLWWVLRAFSGYCFAVLYIVIESWLNAKADNQSRGAVFSVYIMINLTVLTAGQMMIGLAQPSSFALFGLASILVSIAAIPVAFTAASTPTPAEFVRPRLFRLYGISPVGVGGCFAVGLANGSFWTLGPVFAQNLGMDVVNVGLYMSAVVLGGALGQWPLGVISDRMDRRIVMLVAAAIAIAAAVATVLIPAADHTAIMAAGVFFGFGSFPLYPLAVAHANDVAEPHDYVEVSSGLLLIYSVGAAAGPLLPSVWKQYAGMPTLYMFTAGVHIVLIAYVVERMRRRPEIAEDRVVFTDAAIAAQTVTNFDPLSASVSEAEDPPAA
ncbi:MFS transporter [Hyphomicrobium sp. CS1GBMeth3]|uniref:MFS transporter n=1 Tax=Hyphomicrobium sp. CS1GBMeth3 TaxID=1892845 RepID=UPI001AED0681|nr:MFS transporter [Hyphomicrobium sp. CS1GBMeth3]